ncbi:MAG: NAD kinase [Jatrophihabitans sp.]|nr:MAG: NAD kinase [Jatrophihabitans sp.]
MTARSVLLVAHTARPALTVFAARTAAMLQEAGVQVRMLAAEAAAVAAAGTVEGIVPAPAEAAAGSELVIVLGGDGTFLRAVEMARPAGVPMLGVNLGHVGFLAEIEPNALADTVRAIVQRQYEVDERVTVEAQVLVGGGPTAAAWALNEVSLERTNRERMLEISVAVDDRPLLRFGCDGLLCATPTGSTAYAFSMGGPILWPTVDAFLVVPNAAHALFARPLVVAPGSVVSIDLPESGHDGVLSCDGRRSVPVPAGARVLVRRGSQPVRIVRLGDWSFTDRLVSKFALPVHGFRQAAGGRDAP